MSSEHNSNVKPPVMRFQTFGQIIKDKKFPEFLESSIYAKFNPPLPPAGMKYVSQPWKRAHELGLDNPAKLLEEFERINLKQSKLPSEIRKFIVGIMEHAANATAMYHFRIDNPELAKEAEKAEKAKRTAIQKGV